MKNLPNKSLVIDIDGVMADFEGAFCDAFGTDHREEVNLEKRYPEHAEIIREFVKNSYVYLDLIPIFEGLMLAWEAHHRGYYVILATSRPKNSQENTKIWLEQYNVPHNELWFTSNKGEWIGKFNQYHPTRRVLMMVDDMVSNFSNLPSGVQPVVFSQPWNKGEYPRMWYDENRKELRIQLDTESKDISFWS